LVLGLNVDAAAVWCVAIRAQVHGDVFRPPSRLPLFAALIGTGASVLRSLALSRSFVFRRLFAVVCR
jgi:hypothetical protein